MAMDYTPFVELAQELVADAGRSVTIQQLSSAAVNPAKPWEGAGTPTVSDSRVVLAVFVPASGSGLGQMVFNDELLARVEQVAIVAPTDIDIEKFNTIIDDSVRWNIDWAKVLKPGDTTLLYVFGVKR